MQGIRTFFFSALALSILYSCDSKDGFTVKGKIDHEDQKEYEIETVEEPINNRQKADSTEEIAERELRQDSAQVIRILRRHLKDGHYEAEFTLENEIAPSVNVRIRLGNLFSPTLRHALIKRENEYCTNIEVFLLTDSSMNCVISDAWSPFVFIKDTIFDVNGDSLKDYLVHFYPASGCCTRDVYDTFIFRERNGSFCSKIDLMNPLFFPKQKMIRGLSYGHFPDRYTCRWIGHRLDTVEVLEMLPKNYEASDYYWLLHRRGRKPVRMKELPKRYQFIEF